MEAISPHYERQIFKVESVYVYRRRIDGIVDDRLLIGQVNRIYCIRKGPDIRSIVTASGSGS